MSNPLREHLVGYLLNAGEPEERTLVEQHLQHDDSLRRDVQLLQTALQPLALDAGHHEPPPGLAQRCCQYVYSRIELVPAALSPLRSDVASAGPVRQRWSWLDLSVAGAIAVAVAVLLVPAVYQSRLHSQLLACQNNLKNIGTALTSFSENNGGYFPDVKPGARLNAAGMWAPTLMSNGLLAHNRSVLCPSTDEAGDSKFRVYKLDELEAMTDAQRAAILPRLSPSYGYTLGYRDGGGEYKSQKNGRRRNFALVADTPTDGPGNSRNHGGGGQNVLFEDGSVRYLNSRKPDHEDDDIFRNRLGEVAPGTNSDDSVIVPGHFRPR